MKKYKKLIIIVAIVIVVGVIAYFAYSHFSTKPVSADKVTSFNDTLAQYKAKGFNDAGAIMQGLMAAGLVNQDQIDEASDTINNALGDNTSDPKWLAAITKYKDALIAGKTHADALKGIV